MKCARCGKELDKPAAMVGGQPIGPKCWQKMGHKTHKLPRVYLPVKSLLDDNQKDLFDDLPIS